MLSQWELIVVVNTAFNESDLKAWRTSHIRVNSCPSQMLSFEEWVKKHKDMVWSADQFFQTQKGLYEA